MSTQRYVAFLRGINLGKRRLPMSVLKELFIKLGFDQVETFIASGNVLFSTSKSRNQLETLIARHLGISLGYAVDTFVRTTEEVAAIGKTQVFSDDGQEGITIHVGFWSAKPTPEVARKLAAIRTGDDEFRVIGREYYWLCRTRTSDSKVWSLPAVKVLRLPSSSMRNMTSIRKIVAKHLG